MSAFRESTIKITGKRLEGTEMNTDDKANIQSILIAHGTTRKRNGWIISVYESAGDGVKVLKARKVKTKR